LFDRFKLPAFHDPFAGGGSIPLEAQRLGLESYASDLNPVAVLINNWFNRHQGTLIGILLASVSAGASLMTQVVVWSLNSYGWRASYRLTAVIAFLISIPAILMIKDKPSDKGLLPYGAEMGVISSKTEKIEYPGVLLRDSFKSTRFWFGMLGFFLIGSCVHPVFTVLPGYVTDSGLSPASAGIVTGVAYIAAATSKIILGKVYDKKGLSPLIWISFLCFTVSS
jgi:sugar phosphate permease